MEEIDVEFDFYIIRNQEGKYFRRKGYGGSGKSWVEEILQARIYTTLRAARTIVTFYANNYPAYGIPDLLLIKGRKAEVLNEADRIQKSRETKVSREAKAKARRAKEELERAQQEVERAQSYLEKLKKK